jgi:hypothetical protein
MSDLTSVTTPAVSLTSGSTTSRRAGVGRVLLVIVAALTVVLPVLLDGVVLAGAHMQNPAWLPHAKLHAAISFLAAVALGGGALVCLLARPVTDRFAMAMGAYLAGAFWVALIAAGCWPGTSYYFAGDPVYAPSGDAARTLGVPNNVATAVLMIAVVVVGLVLVLAPGRRREVWVSAPCAPARAGRTSRSPGRSRTRR